MITFNGQKYAKTNREYVLSLFIPGGLPVGFYRETKKFLILQDFQKKEITRIKKGK